MSGVITGAGVSAGAFVGAYLASAFVAGSFTGAFAATASGGTAATMLGGMIGGAFGGYGIARLQGFDSKWSVVIGAFGALGGLGQGVSGLSKLSAYDLFTNKNGATLGGFAGLGIPQPGCVMDDGGDGVTRQGYEEFCFGETSVGGK